MTNMTIVNGTSDLSVLARSFKSFFEGSLGSFNSFDKSELSLFLGMKGEDGGGMSGVMGADIGAETLCI
jgi:hypothetical protein